MNKRYKIGFCILLLFVIICLLLVNIAQAETEKDIVSAESISMGIPITDVQQELKAEQQLNKYKNKKVKYITKEAKKYSYYITSKQKKKIKKYKKSISIAILKTEIKKPYKKAIAIIKKAKQLKKRFWNTGPTDFASRGEISYKGHRFTYYSSKVLYHYQTKKWTPDNLGFYRDKNGYLVVAADFISQGDLIKTPWGIGKKYDCGAGYNTVDMYVNW